MISQNVIRRRKLDPLLVRASEVVRHYEKAAGCAISVLGPDCYPLDDSASPKACVLCKRHCRNAQTKAGSPEHPCIQKHSNAVKNSRRLGGSYIYMCDMGFVFWTSPFFSGKHFAGALIAGGVLGVTQKQAAENIHRNTGGAISRKEIGQYLDSFPEKKYDEVKALAQMMLICAGHLSQNEEEIPAEPENFLSGGKDTGRERKLLASLRRGDTREARKILDDLWKTLNSDDDFAAMQVKAIELTVLISRAAAGTEEEDNSTILETNNRYLKKIEEAENTKELSDILNAIIDRMSGRMFSFQGVRHSSALRKAERYIRENYTRKISLRKIARVAGLSAPYFSTIFKDEMGENLCNYLNRLRVGKAAVMLAETSMPISKISTACGFEDQSWFSKIFKCHIGLSPGKYREREGICAVPDWISEKNITEAYSWNGTKCAE